MRLKKYKCPKDSMGWGCLYGGPFLKDGNEKCINCGVYYFDTMTIWDHIEDFYRIILPYKFRPKNIWRSLKDRFWYKWTTIKPRTLGHNWCDYSHLVPEIIFEMNARFVEREISNECRTPEDWEKHKERNPEFYKAWNKLVTINNWWKCIPPDGPTFFKDKEKMEGWDLEEEEKHNKLVREQCKTIIECTPWMWT